VVSRSACRRREILCRCRLFLVSLWLCDFRREDDDECDDDNWSLGRISSILWIIESVIVMSSL